LVRRRREVRVVAAAGAMARFTMSPGLLPGRNDAFRRILIGSANDFAQFDEDARRRHD
jgi:hypothetical protein